MNQPGQPGFCQRGVLHFLLWGRNLRWGHFQSQPWDKSGQSSSTLKPKKTIWVKLIIYFLPTSKSHKCCRSFGNVFFPKYTTPKLPTRWVIPFSHQLTSADFNGFIFIKPKWQEIFGMSRPRAATSVATNTAKDEEPFPSTCARKSLKASHQLKDFHWDLPPQPRIPVAN